MPPSIETWKAIPGFPAYEISDAGRVRCAVTTYRRRPGSVFKQQLGSDGYLRIGLWRDGKRSDRLVHRILLETFVGQPPSPHHQAAHWDNDRSNNRLSNLRWATPKENKLDSRRHGTIIRGEARPGAKLNDEMVRALRARRRGGEQYETLAREVGVSPGAISLACRGLTWAHVK